MDTLSHIEFDNLMQPGTIGYYDRCEVNEVFLICRATKKIYNYYILAVFEEAPLPSKKEENLTPKLISVSPEWSLGIVRHYETISQARDYYLRLVKENRWVFRGSELSIPNLTNVPQQYIPADGVTGVPLNLALKNNYFNGSYILEFFDEEKILLSKFSLDDVAKINEHLKAILPIDLAFVNERIGNIIFQLPITTLSVRIYGTENQDGFNARIAWHPRIQKPPSHVIQVINDLDETFAGFRLVNGNDSGCTKIRTGNSRTKYRLTVINPDNELILYSHSGSLIGKVAFTMNIDTGIEPRTVNISGRTEAVKLTHLEQHGIGFEDKSYIEQIQGRASDNEKKALERRGTISQYCRNGTKEKDRAINDIRELISRLGRKSICLWDPYLTYEDIIGTLYFSPVFGATLRAIGAFNDRTRDVVINGVATKQKIDFSIWKAEQVNGFINASNNIGINLEFRCKHGTYGWDFHDRFLLFPAETSFDTPRVWSLGSSVNGLGDKHHIVQEVPYAKIIIDEFEQLWNLLNTPDCLVWRSMP